MTWEVYIDGDKGILEALSEVLEGHDTNIIVHEKGFILSSPTFDNQVDAGTVRDEASKILDSLNGIAATLLPPARPIRFSHIEEISDEGRRNIIIQPEPAVLRLSGSLSKVVLRDADGNIKEVRSPADPAPSWLASAMLNDKVAKALRLRGQGDLDWADLYRLFEVIEDGAGGIDEIVNKRWASRKQIGLFKHTANSAGAIGDVARHGKEATTPPKKPMKLSRARTSVDLILTSWLNSL